MAGTRGAGSTDGGQPSDSRRARVPDAEEQGTLFETGEQASSGSGQPGPGSGQPGGQRGHATTGSAAPDEEPDDGVPGADRVRRGGHHLPAA